MVLEHNATYKISSVFDGCVGIKITSCFRPNVREGERVSTGSRVLDVKGGNKTKRGTPILSWDWSNSKNQKWTANGESDGFRLATLLPPYDKDSDYVAVLDEGANDLLVLWSFNAKLNQQWIAEEVPNGGGAVIIKNIRSGKCLRNMGHGHQVKCVPASADDRGTWWNLTRLA